VSTATGTRARRRQAIVELVSGERLGSQEEIRSRLAQLGHQATQSTISRDLEELGLARVHDAEGALGGAEKADAARRAFVEGPSPKTPASLVRATNGSTTAILDRAAAAKLSP